MVQRAATRIGEDGPRPGEADLDALAASLRVLANPKRLRLLRFLTKPHYVEEVASELRMARQTAEQHLQQLLEAGLVQRMLGEREKRRVTEYVVVPQRLFTVHEALWEWGAVQPEIDNPRILQPATQALAPRAASASAAETARLVIVYGMRVGESTSLISDGPWLVGRDPHASVCLDYDPFVSTHHAEVRRGPGGYEVADLYSRNGTFVDWKPVTRGGVQPLGNGAVLRAGRTLLLFRKAVAD